MIQTAILIAEIIHSLTPESHNQYTAIKEYEERLESKIRVFKTAKIEYRNELELLAAIKMYREKLANHLINTNKGKI